MFFLLFFAECKYRATCSLSACRHTFEQSRGRFRLTLDSLTRVWTCSWHHLKGELVPGLFFGSACEIAPADKILSKSAWLKVRRVDCPMAHDSLLCSVQSYVREYLQYHRKQPEEERHRLGIASVSSHRHRPRSLYNRNEECECTCGGLCLCLCLCVFFLLLCAPAVLLLLLTVWESSRLNPAALWPVFLRTALGCSV